MKLNIKKFENPSGELTKDNAESPGILITTKTSTKSVNKDLPNKFLNTAKFVFNDVLPIVTNPISKIITSAIKGDYNSNSPLYKLVTQTLVQPIARKIGRTPSGFTVNIPNIVKLLGNNETTLYTASFPSQDAYYYGSEKYFPKSTHEPRINSSIKLHDVNFGRNVFEIPKLDSINFVNNLNNTITTQEGYPINEEFQVINDVNSSLPYFYDAGNYTLIPKKDKNGNYFVYLNDVYDFDPKLAKRYAEKYDYNLKDNKTSNQLKTIALSAMTLMGEPYEVHQTVPVKFVNKINEPTEITSANVRDMFKNVLKLHNVELIKPVDSFSEDEIRQMFVSGSGDDLIQHWRNLNLIK